mmetsp:Transcript_66956/g.217894  ORF Transcript_66956/g.217894 Transcript_66956/m.217894 type:complete len:251 (-) Transcript_66956:693-1445(-)
MAPILRPKDLQSACGMISPKSRTAVTEKATALTGDIMSSSNTGKPSMAAALQINKVTSKRCCSATTFLISRAISFSCSSDADRSITSKSMGWKESKPMLRPLIRPAKSTKQVAAMITDHHANDPFAGWCPPESTWTFTWTGPWMCTTSLSALVTLMWLLDMCTETLSSPMGVSSSASRPGSVRSASNSDNSVNSNSTPPTTSLREAPGGGGRTAAPGCVAARIAASTLSKAGPMVGRTSRSSSCKRNSSW